LRSALWLRTGVSAVIFKEIIHIEQSKISQSLLFPNAFFVTGKMLAPKKVPLFAFSSPTLFLIIVKMRKVDRQMAVAKKGLHSTSLVPKVGTPAAIACYQRKSH